MLREAISWRLADLLSQSLLLHEQGRELGARILLRSAFETLATLVYLNQIVQQVLDGDLAFNEFGKKTTVLLLGARNNERVPKSINIVTILEKCDKRYPGLMGLYADLSESAHPSYEGLVSGYSKVDRDEYETHFSNRWSELYGEQHAVGMELCMETFLFEYNEVWISGIEKLEKWIAENDAMLEASKNESD